MCILLFTAAGAVIILYTEKGRIEIFLNRYHDPFLDVFFSQATKLGEGFYPVLIILALFFRRIYYGLLAAASVLLTFLIAQFLKRFVFDTMLRPKEYLKDIRDLYFLEDLPIHTHFSFPSGHASSAFALFCMLAIFSKNNYLQLLCFIAAFLTALSRIYLLQHFFVDVYAGALLGTMVTVLVYYLAEFHTSIKSSSHINRPLIRFTRS